MIRARPRPFVLWLLPLLLWQLLLPPGVMPGSGAQGATLVLCSMHHVPMAPGAHQGDQVPAGKHSAGVCPFAAVGAAAPLPSLAMILCHDAAMEYAGAPSSGQRRAATGPLRAQLSRAPPTLS